MNLAILIGQVLLTVGAFFVALVVVYLLTRVIALAWLNSLKDSNRTVINQPKDK